MLERAFADATTRSIANYRLIASALAGAPVLTTPFPPDNDLAAQLQMVAQLISVRAAGCFTRPELP